MAEGYRHPKLPKQFPLDLPDYLLEKRFNIRQQAVSIAKNWIEHNQRREEIFITLSAFQLERQEFEKLILEQTENQNGKHIAISPHYYFQPKGSKCSLNEVLTWKRDP